MYRLATMHDVTERDRQRDGRTTVSCQ